MVVFIILDERARGAMVKRDTQSKRAREERAREGRKKNWISRLLKATNTPRKGRLGIPVRGGALQLSLFRGLGHWGNQPCSNVDSIWFWFCSGGSVLGGLLWAFWDPGVVIKKQRKCS